MHQTTHLEKNLFKIENKITRYSLDRTVFSFDLLLVDFLVQLSIFDTRLCESFLFGKNGSSTVKQLVVITFLVQKYLYLSSSHRLSLSLSPQMKEVLQTILLKRNLFKIQKKITRYSNHRTVFSFDLVLFHFSAWLYIFDMSPCESFLLSKNGLLILKQLLLITFLIRKYLHLFSYHPLNLHSRQMTEIL